MTSPENDLDPGETHEAAGELLAHLQRVGVRFIPQPKAESVESWNSRWIQDAVPADSQPAVAATSPQSPPQTSAAGSSIGPEVKTPPRAPDSRLQPVESFSASDDPYPGTSLPIAERENQLANLASVVAGCTKCTLLAKCRTQTVFGEGKCRPPENRNPDPAELANCREYFEQQLQILRPEYIVCLGAVSAHSLLKTKLSIGRLRQRFHQYHESKVLVIYHPAYLLRNPDAKKAAWADLQMLMRDAGLA
mgnify:CR=1 FL=1